MGGISRGSREEKQSAFQVEGLTLSEGKVCELQSARGLAGLHGWGPCSPHQPRRICRVLATRGGVRRGGAEVWGWEAPESFIKPQQRRRDASDSDPLKTEPGSCRAPAKRGRRTQASEPGLRWGPRPRPTPASLRPADPPRPPPRGEGPVLDGRGKVPARPGWASWSQAAETC